jgi:hypothetical protein
MGQNSAKLFSQSESDIKSSSLRSKFNFTGIKEITRHPYISCLCSNSESTQSSDPELFPRQSEYQSRPSRTILDKGREFQVKPIDSRHSFSYGANQSPGIRKSFELISTVVHSKMKSFTPNNRNADLFFNPSRTSSNRNSSRKSSIYVQENKTEGAMIESERLETVQEAITGRGALDEKSNHGEVLREEISAEFREVVESGLMDSGIREEVFLGGGRRYKGDLQEGKPHGCGKEIWPDGSLYEGMYHFGTRTGEGLFVWPDKSLYKGNFIENEMQGFGIFEWSNGNKYEGMWNKSKMHGEGTYTWSNGNKYIGSYFEGLKHGEGTFVYHDGRIVKGKWLKGHIKADL